MRDKKGNPVSIYENSITFKAETAEKSSLSSTFTFFMEV